MASLWYYFSVRDNSATGQGTRVSGLSPSWVFLKKLADNSDIAPLPVFVEIAQGVYKYSYDSELSGDAAGQIDAVGSSTSVTLSPGDRYIDVFPTRESSRLLSGINASGQVALASSGLDAIQIENGVNARQAFTPILAASAGVLLGAGTGTVIIKGGNTPVTRITATTDNAGNRTAVTLSIPA